MNPGDPRVHAPLSPPLTIAILTYSAEVAGALWCIFETLHLVAGVKQRRYHESTTAILVERASTSHDVRFVF